MILCKVYNCNNEAHYRLPQTGDEFCELCVMANVIRLGILPEDYEVLKKTNQIPESQNDSETKEKINE